jgi:hypothetical protein
MWRTRLSIIALAPWVILCAHGRAEAQSAEPVAPPAPQATPQPTPTPATAPSPPAATNPSGSSWDAAIQQSNARDRALETDEERDRREERLRRGRSSPFDSSAFDHVRLGIRLDAGAWYNESSGSGDINLQGGPSLQLVGSLGQVTEFFGTAGWVLGGGKFFSYGPSLDVGVRFVIQRAYVGGGANFAAWHVKTDGTCGTDDYGLQVYCQVDDVRTFIHGLITGGFFVDPGRSLEFGADVRLGAQPTDGQISFYPTVHLAYLWGL